MKLQYILFFFLFCAVFFSCKKEKQQSIEGNWYTYDKPIIDEGGNTFINYEELYFDGDNLFAYLEVAGFISPKKYAISNDSIYSFHPSEKKNATNFVGILDTITKNYFTIKTSSNIKYHHKIVEGTTIEDVIINNKIPTGTNEKKYNESFYKRFNLQLSEKKNVPLVKYAKGFDIQQFENYTKLTIKAPYPKATEQFEYILVSKEKEVPQEVEHLHIIRTPVERIVVTSTTHIPMLELLAVENNLVGFPNTQYISSEKTRALIDNGAIKELGKEQDINTEILLDLAPELVVGFSMSSNNKMFKNIEKAGVQVVLNGDWLEETPLGRSEWIKFFGVLFNKEKLAEEAFDNIEKEYKQATILASEATNKPTILSGVQFKDVWNLPAGESFVAQFLKDANTNYLWSDSKGKGSLSLSFETVFEKAQNAQLWIAPGHYTGYNQLKGANAHYAQFNAFNTKNIYSFNNKKGSDGGVIYYELAPIQPHIVLKDIIKIAHPELLPNYTPYFLAQLQE